MGEPRDIPLNTQVQDVLPTLIELCGLKDTRGARFDGISLAGLLKGSAKTLPDRMLVVQYGQILKKWDCCVMWNRWRLAGESELYDLRSDPGQKNDVAAQNPAVRARMREHYERWWGGIAARLGEYCPLSIGSRQENPVMLCSADWQDIYADNPRHIAEAVGGPRGGHWNVRVEQDGEYEIGLRRWHTRLNIPIAAACPPQKRRKGELPAGEAKPIARAQLRIAGQEQTLAVERRDTAAKFRVRLKGGTRTQLHGWFQDAQGNDLCGAFYAGVRRL